MATSGKAKQKALDELKARPPVDEAVLAERRHEWKMREQARSSERTAKAEAVAADKAEAAAIKARQLASEKEAAELKAARLKPTSAAEMKTGRDARYAARQARRK